LRSPEQCQTAVSQLSNLGVTIQESVIRDRLLLTTLENPNRDLIERVMNAEGVISFRPRYSRHDPTDGLLVLDEILAVFTSPTDLETAEQTAEGLNLEADASWSRFPTTIVLYRWLGSSERQTLTEVIRELSRRSGIKSAEPNLGNNIRTLQSPLIPNDPLWEPGNLNSDPHDPFRWNPGEWNLERVGMPEVWQILYNTSPSLIYTDTIEVAILDTWAKVSHLEWWDRVPEGNFASFVTSGHLYFFDQSHGTLVTSVAAASSNDYDLLAGVAGKWEDGVSHSFSGIKLVLVEMIDSTGVTTTAAIDAFEFACERGADVINCSWLLLSPSPAVDQIITEVTTIGRHNYRGCVIVFGCGNQADLYSELTEPSDHPCVIAVGATDYNDVRYAYSQYDASGGLDLVAPSGFYPPDRLGSETHYPYTYVPSTTTSKEDTTQVFPYTRFGGTSAAAPLVSGVAALILCLRPDLPYFEVRNVLTSTATKIEGGSPYLDGFDPESYTYTNGYNPKVGFGQLNALAAIQAVLDYPDKITGLHAGEPSTDCEIPENCQGNSMEPPEFQMLRRPIPDEFWCVRLDWNNPDYGWHRYVIWRSEDGEFYVPIFWTDNSPYTCFVDATLWPGETYWWKVAQLGSEGQMGTLSAPVSKTIPGEEMGAGVPMEPAEEKVEFGIQKAWPNPFNPEVQIRYGLTETTHKVCIAVINVRGQTVFETVRNDQDKGYHEFTWNGRNRSGQQVASGVYFILVEADGRRSTKQVSLIR
jgi:subtilisin family serine protease